MKEYEAYKEANALCLEMENMISVMYATSVGISLSKVTLENNQVLYPIYTIFLDYINKARELYDTMYENYISLERKV